MRFATSSPPAKPPPSLLAGVYDVAAKTLTLTFDQVIQAGSIGGNQITINGVPTKQIAADAQSWSAGSMLTLACTIQLSSTSGTPRITYNAPNTVFVGPLGQTVPRFIDYPITTI